DAAEGLARLPGAGRGVLGLEPYPAGALARAAFPALGRRTAGHGGGGCLGVPDQRPAASRGGAARGARRGAPAFQARLRATARRVAPALRGRRACRGPLEELLPVAVGRGGRRAADILALVEDDSPNAGRLQAPDGIEAAHD